MFSIGNAILITCYIDQWRDTKIFVLIFLNYQNLQYLSVCEIQRQKFINKAIFRPSVFICFIMQEYNNTMLSLLFYLGNVYIATL